MGPTAHFPRTALRARGGPLFNMGDPRKTKSPSGGFTIKLMRLIQPHLQVRTHSVRTHRGRAFYGSGGKA